MKEQIKQALEWANENNTFVAPQYENYTIDEWLRWQSERIEQLEKALEWISYGASDLNTAVRHAIKALGKEV